MTRIDPRYLRHAARELVHATQQLVEVCSDSPDPTVQLVLGRVDLALAMWNRTYLDNPDALRYIARDLGPFADAATWCQLNRCDTCNGCTGHEPAGTQPQAWWHEPRCSCPKADA